jgi:RimJ/RimL family protein N-acetyltransferase
MVAGLMQLSLRRIRGDSGGAGVCVRQLLPVRPSQTDAGAHGPFSIPHLQTRRLSLREYRMTDFDAYAGHLADPRAMSLFGVLDKGRARQAFSSNTRLS